MSKQSIPAYRLLEELDEFQLAQQAVYQDPTEHVRDELARLAIWIELRGLILKRQGVIDEGDRFRGMILRDGELANLIKRASTRPKLADDDAEVARKHHQFEVMTRDISLREAATLWSVSNDAGGCRLPLVELSHQFGLNRFQYHVILLGLAPEVDLSFQRMFSYLLNDVTRKRPNVSLALELFGGNAVGRREGRSSFLPGSPLLKFNLIELDRTSGALEPSLLLRDFKMPERMVLWLLGNGSLSPELSRYTEMVPGVDGFEALAYDKRVLMRLQALSQHLSSLNKTQQAVSPIVLLQGPDGVGKRSVARRLSFSVARELLLVDLEAASVPPSVRDRVFTNIIREARLHNRALCLANYSTDLMKAGGCPSLGYLYSVLGRSPGLGVLTSRSSDIGLRSSAGGFSTRISLEVPDTYGRLELWEKLTEGQVELGADVDLRTFSLKYGFTGGAILRVLAHAKEEATMRTGVTASAVTVEDLEAACRIQLGQGMSNIASRVRAKATLEEIVLPTELRETIQEIIEQAKYRNTVFHDWGFDRKLTSGKGLSCLFSGPPGTGKTMVAGVIASELNMELFKVDLSQVVSKYVGETEKNLGAVFESAQGNQFIILFDEADSLFSKRTEVKSSVDRYANLEVNYLLQKIEEFGGMCVLTTNFEKSIDDAFKRRLNFRVDFPFPEEEFREQLWRKLLPDEAPRDDDIAYDWLAEKYELSGGNIRNAILRAAFWAAAKSRPISMDDLELAAEKEARELGKLVQGFGRY